MDKVPLYVKSCYTAIIQADRKEIHTFILTIEAKNQHFICSIFAKGHPCYVMTLHYSGPRTLLDHSGYILIAWDHAKLLQKAAEALLS
jgi:hypothetical protein